MMKSRIAGIGLRIDQGESSWPCPLPFCLSATRHDIAVVEEAGAMRDDARVGAEAAGDLDAVADAAADADLRLRHLVVASPI